MKIDIGNRTISDNSPVFIIAELSCNHGGKLDLALETIDAMYGLELIVSSYKQVSLIALPLTQGRMILLLKEVHYGTIKHFLNYIKKYKHLGNGTNKLEIT